MVALRPRTISLIGQSFSQPTSKNWLLPLVAIPIFLGVAWLAVHSVSTTLRQEIENSLVTILKADVKAMSLWLEDKCAALESATTQPAVAVLLRQTIAESRGRSAHSERTATATQAELANALNPFVVSHSLMAYTLTDHTGQYVASSDDFCTGMRIPSDYTQFFDRVLSGENVIMAPHKSVLSLSVNGKQENSVPVMLVLGPVLSAEGKVVGTLSFLLRPQGQFTEVLGVARSGESGETYAVDATALMLSESRFEPQLREIGLLNSNEDSSLRIAVRNPGGDMTQGFRPSVAPLAQPYTQATASIASAALGEGDPTIHTEIEPYNDYRGVKVVGAWQWLADYQFGIITEVDASEAFAPLRQLQTIFWALLGLLGLAVAGVIAYSLLIERAWRKLHKAERKLEKLGQYELLEKVGAGGMGDVYRARHAMLRRDTAVKILRRNVADQTAVARFEREVQSTSQLNCSNTIQIFDYGHTPDGTFYYAMEFLHGIDLSDLVKRFGPLPDGRTRFILMQVCRSLHEAHQAQLIHRDIKPSNIMLNMRGGQSDVVKVLDFGLVRSIAAGQDMTLTIDGGVTGTPAYMSPESAQTTEEIDARSDIYSLGCVAFCLLSGQPPFTGRTPVETCWKQVREPPPQLSELCKEPISDELEKIVMKCLAKSPADRPQSSLELLSQLENCPTNIPWVRVDADAWWSLHGDQLDGTGLEFDDETEVDANTQTQLG